MMKRSRGRRAGEFPVATMAAYGSDTRRATKLVVSILQRGADQEPSRMRTWTTESGDVRSNPIVAAELDAFLSDCRVKRTVEADRIIGCPHEEGIDYPMGRTCPLCPFWAGIDRFTHEPIREPAPSVSPEEVLRLLADDRSNDYKDALTSADAHREALVGPLLEALDRGIANPTGASEQDASLFSYALYLLAKWRDPRAYPYVVRWLRLPGEQPFALAGDVVTQDGARILAGVCDGNLGPIQALVLDREAGEYGRSAGVTALALLAAWAELPRAAVMDWLLWLARQGLEREPSAVWDGLAAESADIEALELFPELRRAYGDGLIDPMSVGASELDEVEAMPRGEMVRKTRERHPPIDDVLAATAWWHRQRRNTLEQRNPSMDRDDRWDERTGTDVEPAGASRAPARVGRNEPCPCGSGKKYKKCCGR
jgi:hypothetical protein